MPDDLLEKAEKIAKQKGTTVSAIMRDLLIDYTENESEIEVIKKRLEKLEKEVFGKKK